MRKCGKEDHANRGEDARPDVIEHHACRPATPVGLADGAGLPDIEEAEEKNGQGLWPYAF